MFRFFSRKNKKTVAMPTAIVAAVKRIGNIEPFNACVFCGIGDVGDKP